MDLNLCISNGTVSTIIYDERDDFDFDIINFPFLDDDVPRRTSYGVYISQLIRFARASSNLNDFIYRNKALTAKRLRQGYRYFKLRKASSKFYRRHSALVEKYSVSLKTLLQQGISESGFYGDLMYRFRKKLGKKKVRENSRECHNHKPQPFPDPKRKKKPKYKPNKRTKSTKISSLFPKRGNRNNKRTEKHENKMTHGKTYNKSPRRINHKATKSKTYLSYSFGNLKTLEYANLVFCHCKKAKLHVVKLCYSHVRPSNI